MIKAKLIWDERRGFIWQSIELGQTWIGSDRFAVVVFSGVAKLVRGINGCQVDGGFCGLSQ